MNLEIHKERNVGLKYIYKLIIQSEIHESPVRVLQVVFLTTSVCFLLCRFHVMVGVTRITLVIF